MVVLLTGGIAVKKHKILLGAAVFALLSFAGLTGLANAHSFRTGENVTVGQGQKIEDTLFASGRTIDIASEVDGDIFCAAQTVNISGTVNGDVICAGQTINITGRVNGDVRLAGQTVSLSSVVSGNATIAGQTFTLSSSGRVNGDVTVGSTDSTLNGIIGRDLAAGAENVEVAGLVGRNIKGNVDNLTLTNRARVGGSIEYTSNNDVSRAAGAEVRGTITRTDAPEPSDSKSGAIFGFSLGWFIYLLLAMLVIAMAFALLFPGFIHRSSSRALASPVKTPLVGLAATILVPVILIVLSITIVGLPLAFILALLWLVTLILSGPLFGYFIGRLALRGSDKPLLIMLAGSSILLVLYFIPIIGAIALLAAIWFGVGMVVLEILDRSERPVYKVGADASLVSKKPNARKDNK